MLSSKTQSLWLFSDRCVWEQRPEATSGSRAFEAGVSVGFCSRTRWSAGSCRPLACVDLLAQGMHVATAQAGLFVQAGMAGPQDKMLPGSSSAAKCQHTCMQAASACCEGTHGMHRRVDSAKRSAAKLAACSYWQLGVSDSGCIWSRLAQGLLRRACPCTLLLDTTACWQV